MLISYDNLADAVYIQLQPDTEVAKTVEFAPETFVDLDAHGELIGVELLNPTTVILRKLAKKYHRPELSAVHPDKLQEAVA